SYTKWKQISNQMRFFVDGYRRPAGITDDGKATEWVLPALPRDRHTTEDYAIVSRVFHPDTHAMLVELAGITQYGTDAAADLVTNPNTNTATHTPTITDTNTTTNTATNTATN